MQAIERFFMNIFDRIRYSATYTAERKIREAIEDRYNRATAPKENKESDRTF